MTNPNTGASADQPDDWAQAPAESSIESGAEISTGPDAARAALARARAKAKAAGDLPGSKPGKAPRSATRRPAPGVGYSGPGPDERDPQTAGRLVDRLVDERAWKQPLAIGTVIAAWNEVVGAEVADHCVPESIEEGGVLVVQADSTAWATQLRLLSSSIVGRLGEAVPGGGITSVLVRGPQPPSWKKGRRSVPGRGPRDTYG